MGKTHYNLRIRKDQEERLKKELGTTEKGLVKGLTTFFENLLDAHFNYVDADLKTKKNINKL